jgi:hypothetical protein
MPSMLASVLLALVLFLGGLLVGRAITSRGTAAGPAAAPPPPPPPRLGSTLRPELESARGLRRRRPR